MALADVDIVPALSATGHMLDSSAGTLLGRADDVPSPCSPFLARCRLSEGKADAGYRAGKQSSQCFLHVGSRLLFRPAAHQRRSTHLRMVTRSVTAWAACTGVRV